jgi:hypothetical protein
MSTIKQRTSVKKEHVKKERVKKEKVKIDSSYHINPNPPRTLKELNDQYEAKYNDICGYDIVNIINNYSSFPMFTLTGSLPKPTKKQLLQMLALCGQPKGTTKECGWFNLLRRSINAIKTIQGIPITPYSSIPSESDLQHHSSVIQYNLNRLFG